MQKPSNFRPANRTRRLAKRALLAPLESLIESAQHGEQLAMELAAVALAERWAEYVEKCERHGYKQFSQ